MDNAAVNEYRRKYALSYIEIRSRKWNFFGRQFVNVTTF